MDYKEYKESLSTTNGKGDDEYVVDTTESKDILPKDLNIKEVNNLVNSLYKYIKRKDVLNLTDLISSLFHDINLYNIEYLQSSLEYINTNLTNGTLLDPNDGIDLELQDGLKREFNPHTNEYKISDNNDDISKVLYALNVLLQYKNQKYGNSALQPINIFSKESSEGSILIRLDDKLSRIKNSDTLCKNDISDIMGYLTLLCVSKGWDDFSEFKD